MGEMIQFNRPDGKTCPAYLVVPDRIERAWLCGHPGVVGTQRSNQKNSESPPLPR